MHTRLSARVSKRSLALDYGQVLRDQIITPLINQCAEGVDQAVAIMGGYSLLREDLDGLLEVMQWPDMPKPFSAVDSKTKAAFTRKYNKEGTPLPYSIAMTVSKKKGGGGENILPWDEEELDDDDEDEEDGSTIGKDATVKMKKSEKVAAKSEASSSKGRGKGAGGKGKGKK